VDGHTKPQVHFKLKTSFVENSLEMGNLPIMMLKICVKESKEHLFSKGK
jgi:hypothetical protein